MVRAYQQLRLDMATCFGLREAIRPGVQEEGGSASRVEEFCRRLYLAFYSLEADPDPKTIDFPLAPGEVMLINNFVSAEDGDWAKDVLHQTRQVLYEHTRGKEAVRLASSADSKLVLEGLTLDPDAAPEPALDELGEPDWSVDPEPKEPDGPEEATKA